MTCKTKWLVVLVAMIVLLAVALDQRLTVTHYALQSDKITAEEGITLVLLTDLHSTVFGQDQQRLIELIVRQQPDLILLVGDIADDEVPLRGTQLLLEGLRGVAPLFYVTGNHEYWSGEVDAIRAEIERHGVTILSDELVQVEVKGTPLIIAGVEDPAKRTYGSPEYDRDQAMASAFGSLGETKGMRILLAHRPENIEAYARYPFDLVLSGHAHGGQMRIPLLLNGLYAPNQGWFPRYAGGVYEHGALTHIVGRGLSINPWMPRVFNPPEIVVVTLTPAQ